MNKKSYSCLAGFLISVILLASPAWSRSPLTDEEVREKIVAESVAKYHASGHPCACPYDSARNGSSCGRRSAYSRPGGASPMCFSSDVTDGMVSDWRTKH